MAKYPPDKRPPPTPKKKNPWDQPPHPKKGDTKDETTFVAIGRALTGWEKAEQSFATLFATLLGLDNDNLPAIRAYGSILTFRGRADMVQAAADAYFFQTPQETLQESVIEAIKAGVGFSARRNEIAHGRVSHLFVPGRVIGNGQTGLSRISEPWGYALLPSEYSTNKTDLILGETILSEVATKPKYTYTSHEIVGMTAKFIELWAATSKLAYEISAHAFHLRRNALLPK